MSTWFFFSSRLTQPDTHTQTQGLEVFLIQHTTNKHFPSEEVKGQSVFVVQGDLLTVSFWISEHTHTHTHTHTHLPWIKQKLCGRTLELLVALTLVTHDCQCPCDLWRGFRSLCLCACVFVCMCVCVLERETCMFGNRKRCFLSPFFVLSQSPIFFCFVVERKRDRLSVALSLEGYQRAVE